MRAVGDQLEFDRDSGTTARFGEQLRVRERHEGVVSCLSQDQMPPRHDRYPLQAGTRGRRFRLGTAMIGLLAETWLGLAAGIEPVNESRYQEARHG